MIIPVTSRKLPRVRTWGILAVVALVSSLLGWLGSSVVADTNLPTAFAHSRPSRASSTRNEEIAGKSKVAERPKLPARRKSLSPDQLVKFRAEMDAFTKEALRPFSEALLREAETNPELKTALELQNSSAAKLIQYGDFARRLRDWEMEPKDLNERTKRNGMVGLFDSTVGFMRTTSAWSDEPFGSTLDRDSLKFRQALACELVDQDIDPRGILGDPADIGAALESVYQQQLRKFNEIVASQGAPSELFSEENLMQKVDYLRIINISYQMMNLTSPETRVLHEEGARRISDFRTELMSRTMGESH